MENNSESDYTPGRSNIDNTGRSIQRTNFRGTGRNTNRNTGRNTGRNTNRNAVNSPKERVRHTFESLHEEIKFHTEPQDNL